MKTTNRWITRTAALLLGLSTVAVGTAGSAQALPTLRVGCTASTDNPSGTVCLTTGSVSRVSRLVTGYKSNLCNYKASITVYNANGTQSKYWSNLHRGCSYGAAWFDFNTAFSVPKGTKVCGSFFQGDQRDGTACKIT